MSNEGLYRVVRRNAGGDIVDCLPPAEKPGVSIDEAADFIGALPDDIFEEFSYQVVEAGSEFDPTVKNESGKEGL